MQYPLRSAGVRYNLILAVYTTYMMPDGLIARQHAVEACERVQ